jgi:hypothetical protein
VLTSILPGVRELRTPLATGYLWLLNAWLLVGQHLPHVRPGGGPLARLWDAGSYGGKGALVVALSFVAYLIGVFVEIDPLLMWEHGGRPRWINAIRNQLRRGALNRIINFFPLSPRATDDLLEFSEEDFNLSREQHRAAVLNGVTREERQLATRLQAANNDLFNRYDRLLSESAFRINVAPPIAALLLIFVWQADLPQWATIILTVLTLLYGATLFAQGATRAIQSRDVIAQAIVVGVVKLRALDRLRSSSDAGSPALQFQTESTVSR